MHAVESMFSVRIAPWWYGSDTQHLGNILNECPDNWDEARMAAGLMWEPVKRHAYDAPAWVQIPAAVKDGETSLNESMLATYGDGVIILESDDHMVRILAPLEGVQQVKRDDINVPGKNLSVVNDDLQIITHADMGGLFEAFADAGNGKLQFETAGSLRGGANVWGLLRLDEPFTIDGDVDEDGDPQYTYPYAVMLNSHDGKGACKFSMTNVRVVCWNTFQAADLGSGRDGFEVNIRHSGDIATKLDDAKLAIAALRENAAAYRDQCNELARIKVSDEVVAQFVEWFIPVPDGSTELTRKIRVGRRDEFMSLYHDSPTSLPGSAYGLVQTSGEWLDHMRRVQTRDSYLSRTVLRREPAKAEAIATIRELVGASS